MNKYIIALSLSFFGCSIFAPNVEIVYQGAHQGQSMYQITCKDLRAKECERVAFKTCDVAWRVVSVDENKERVKLMVQCHE